MFPTWWARSQRSRNVPNMRLTVTSLIFLSLVTVENVPNMAPRPLVLRDSKLIRSCGRSRAHFGYAEVQGNALLPLTARSPGSIRPCGPACCRESRALLLLSIGTMQRFWEKIKNLTAMYHGNWKFPVILGSIFGSRNDSGNHSFSSQAVKSTDSWN